MSQVAKAVLNANQRSAAPETFDSGSQEFYHWLSPEDASALFELSHSQIQVCRMVMEEHFDALCDVFFHYRCVTLDQRNSMA